MLNVFYVFASVNFRLEDIRLAIWFDVSEMIFDLFLNLFSDGGIEKEKNSSQLAVGWSKSNIQKKSPALKLWLQTN